MNKLSTYEQYAAVVGEFKKGRPKCATNKLLMRDDVEALIEAGKLYYEETDGVLWFFSDEQSFYSATLFVPAGTSIVMRPQDKDVVVEITGKGDHYNEQMERDLIEAGFEKSGKYLESFCMLEDVIGDVAKRTKAQRVFWSKQGYFCRAGKKEDYFALRSLWDSVRTRDDYAFVALTDAELEEMEQNGRCIVACDKTGEIRAMQLYINKNNVCYTYIGASSVLGLAGLVSCEKYLHAYEEGCTKNITWIREDNSKSLKMSYHTMKPTGKFFWQFVFRPGRNNIDTILQ